MFGQSHGYTPIPSADNILNEAELNMFDNQVLHTSFETPSPLSIDTSFNVTWNSTTASPSFEIDMTNSAISTVGSMRQPSSSISPPYYVGGLSFPITTGGDMEVLISPAPSSEGSNYSQSSFQYPPTQQHQHQSYQWYLNQEPQQISPHQATQLSEICQLLMSQPQELPRNQQNYNEYLSHNGDPTDLNISFTQTQHNMLSSYIDSSQHSSLWTPHPCLVGQSADSQSQANIPEQTRNKTSRKRKGGSGSRMRCDLKKKREIIQYREDNPNVPVVDIARAFSCPRTSIYAILNLKQYIEGYHSNLPDRCRLVKIPFYILDELLVQWSINLKNRGYTLRPKSYSAQALEICRMLSSLLKEPLPPRKFTSSWVKNFQNRYKNRLESAQSGQTLSATEISRVASNALEAMKNYSADDIYTCDSTCMYLNVMPEAIPGDSNSCHADPSAIATVLLCVNASGTDKREPSYLVRESSNATEERRCNETVLNASLNDVPVSILEGWLFDFDRSLDRNVLLLIDGALRGMLNLDGGSEKLLKHVKITVVSGRLEAMLPMSARIIQDFKTHYYNLLLKDSDDMAKYSAVIRNEKDSGRNSMPTLIPELRFNGEPRCSSVQSSSKPQMLHRDAKPRNLAQSPARMCPLVSQLFQFIRLQNAWSIVSPTVIKHQFTEFQLSLERFLSSQPHESMKILDASRALGNDLLRALPKIYLDQGDSIKNYYMSLDKNSGPSGFLRKTIRNMQNDPNFQNSFADNPSVWKLSFASGKTRNGHSQKCGRAAHIMGFVGQTSLGPRTPSFALYSCRNEPDGPIEHMAVTPTRACTF
ncbi:hypothetical protein BGX27_005704 [Mortierella sp. AM989]|nr:hypothetical protein BGX27_005704 [Mortierella sp. AM989]